MLSERSKTQECILYNSIYIKSKNRKKQSEEIRTVIPYVRYRFTREEPKRTLWVTEMFYTLQL